MFKGLDGLQIPFIGYSWILCIFVSRIGPYIGRLLLPCGIVLLYFPMHRVNETLPAKVVHTMLSS
jgi:hypothetical protein